MKFLKENEWSVLMEKQERQGEKIEALTKDLRETENAILILMRKELNQQFPAYQDLFSKDEIVKKIWRGKFMPKEATPDILEQTPTCDTTLTFQDGNWIGGYGHVERCEILFLDESGNVITKFVKPKEFKEEKDALSDSVLKERALVSEGESIAETLKQISGKALIIKETRDDVAYGFMFVDRTRIQQSGFLYQ